MGRTASVTVEAAVSALVDKLPQLALPPIPGVLHFDAQGVVVGGSVVQVVSAVLKTADGGWLVDDFAATLPGETKVEAKGTLGILPAPSFTGHARIASRRPTAFAGWWRGEVGSAVNIGRFAVEADIDLKPDDRRLDNLVATTGAGTVTGTVDIKRFPQSDSYFVTVDLGADRADLVETRALAELLVGKTMSAGKIEQMTLSLRADVVSAGGVEARSVVVEGGFEDGELSLRHLSVADLAGASIEAIGSIRDPFGKRSGKVEASIKAEDFSGAAEFLASFLPESRLAQHLRRVAPILSPVSAEVSAEAGAAGDKLSLALTGSFADTHLSLDAEGSGSLDDLQTLSGKLKLHADGADSATVLPQLGLNPLPLSSAPLKVDADFDGALAKSGKLSLSGTVAGVDVTYEGETAVSDGKPTTAGAFKAKSKNIDPALLLAGIAVPGVGEGHAASASGHLDYAGGTLNLTLDEGTFNGKPAGGVLAATFAPELKLSGELSLAAVSVPVLAGFAVGTVPGLEQSGWSDSPFAAALPDTIALDLTLNAASLDLGAPIAATDAKLAFQLSRGKLQLDLDSAKFAGGALKGALIATIGDGQADLTLRGGLQGATLGELIWDRSGLPVASGTLDVSFDTVGRGRSMAGVVATLAGSGSFSVTDGRINELNPEALTTVMAAAKEGWSRAKRRRARPSRSFSAPGLSISARPKGRSRYRTGS